MEKKTFTLNNVEYNIDSVTGDARMILNNIFQVKEKGRIEALVNAAGINILTEELSKFVGDFEKTEKTEKTEKVDAELV